MLQVLTVLPFAVAAIGLVLLGVSNGTYFIRTHDRDFLRQFWLKRESLTRCEYLLNRLGFILALGGIFWICLSRLVR
jgi:hypothetical protein